jgi:hypothetical protein
MTTAEEIVAAYWENRSTQFEDGMQKSASVDKVASVYAAAYELMNKESTMPLTMMQGLKNVGQVGLQGISNMGRALGQNAGRFAAQGAEGSLQRGFGKAVGKVGKFMRTNPGTTAALGAGALGAGALGTAGTGYVAGRMMS